MHLLAFLLLSALAPATWGAVTDKVVWKPLEQAVLRVDDRPPRTWNVYRAERKRHLLLVQLGRRFLMLDVREREIYELDAARLESRNKNLLWHEADKPAKPLATADWLIRDAGRTQRIRAKLVAEGRVLEVQLPQTVVPRQLY